MALYMRKSKIIKYDFRQYSLPELLPSLNILFGKCYKFPIPNRMFYVLLMVYAFEKQVGRLYSSEVMQTLSGEGYRFMNRQLNDLLKEDYIECKGKGQLRYRVYRTTQKGVAVLNAYNEMWAEEVRRLQTIGLKL